jgi:hypothetical protein
MSIITGPSPTDAGLLKALGQAVNDTRAGVHAMTVETLAAELDKHLCAHWGPDHGITTVEMLATARDLKQAAGT